MTGLRLVHLQTVIRGVLLTRALRLSRSLITWLLYSRYSHLLAIVKLLWLVVITVHYLACMRHYLVLEQTTNRQATGWSAYFADFFYAICLLQGQGDSTQTDNIAANLFSILTVLLGSVLLAIVFGNVAMLVSNFNANETNYQRKLESVVATMDKLHLPEPLRRRIHQYYTHLWSEYESLDGDIFHFSRELSHTLALEVGLCRYMNLITTISFWKDCSPDFITQIVLSLVVRVYLPHDYVIRKGEIGTELFMINRGICELDLLEAATSLGQSPPRRRSREAPPAADGRSYAQIRKLRHRNSHGGFEMYPGEVLGEMSLLMNYRRTANVLALTHVEMCILTRESFQLLITRYADDRRVVLQRMIQSGIERSCVPIPWQDMCTSTGVDVRELSLSAAAAILVDRLDRNVVDETIKYGFQASDMLPSHEKCSSLHAGENKPSAKIIPTLKEGSDMSRGLPVSHRSGLAKSQSFVLPRLSSFSRRGSLSVTHSTSDLHEMRITSANYDVIMDRFQLRRLTQVDIPPQKTILDPDVAAEAPPLTARRTRHWLEVLLVRLRQPIQPDSLLALLHTLPVVAAFHLQVFFVPFVSIYYYHATAGILRGHVAFEVVFLVDLLLQLNTAYRDDKNRLVLSRRAIFSHRSDMDMPGHSIWTSYFADFFYAICFLQGQGDSSSSDSVPEYHFSILTVLLGSVLHAIVFGNVAMLVPNFNANETNYQRKLENIVATMNKLRDLQQGQASMLKMINSLMDTVQSLKDQPRVVHTRMSPSMRV
ncbi:hypothetical protein Poli38472_006927 [Pythium oligandrum]|uniref:Cyclic nucleotide-binding domain-containing protein n=1 Tax=Pythium oligandrum TaxID=41045 RepID=A0A8K1CA97_PYTOL|nr:hypothetical protein Poli38472_006927 [Pythium oligandrum]|eukprot:TMW58782.1 hypothetical protein Poli38472_006927 [Pythium oligandrum]